MTVELTGVLIGAAFVCACGWVWTYRRLAQRVKEQETREYYSRFIEEERRVLELVATGAPLKEVLDTLTAGIERMSPDCLCSILLLDEDGRRLREGAGGSLPKEYMRIVDGLEIGPDVGSCGSAAFRNETIIVEDIASDYRWAAAKELPMGFGLRSCWSVPIRDANKRVLGTFAMYHRKPAYPEPADLAVVEAGAHLAGNAIERLTSERKLRENIERLGLAEEAAHFGIWESDPARQIMTISAGLASLLGIPKGASLRLPQDEFARFLHPDHWAAMQVAVDQAVADRQPFRIEIQSVTQDGSVRWHRVQGRAEYAGDQAQRLIGATIDITHEKEMQLSLDQARANAEAAGQAQREVEQANAELAAIVECAGTAIISQDLSGNVLTWNRGAERVYGFSAAEMIGNTMAMLIPSGRVGEDMAMMDKLRHGEGTHLLETTRLTKSNGVIHILLTLSPIRNREGDIVGAAQVAWDVTPVKQLERQLAHTQKLESIGQLAAGIAHEINTPIQYIGDNGKFLEEAFRDLVALADEGRETSGTNSPSEAAPARRQVDEGVLDYHRTEVPKAIEELLEGVDQVARIVRAMKEFSHPGPMEKIPVDINRGIESTIMVSRNEWKYVAEITTDLDRRLPPVPCLAGELNQVILNLIVNAAQAIAETPQGAAAKGSIHISTRQDGSFAEIRVKDSGPGIPKAIQSKVFDPFFTTKPVGKGTGQGLALAHAVIVQKHGGSIGLESQPGAGAAFILRLPLACELVEA